MKRYLMILAAAWFMVPATQAGQAIRAGAAAHVAQIQVHAIEIAG